MTDEWSDMRQPWAMPMPLSPVENLDCRSPEKQSTHVIVFGSTEMSPGHSFGTVV